MELYRKIMTADKLPEEDNHYILTELGWMFFHSGNNKQAWRFTKSLEDDEDWEFPGYWFEKVDLPSEEEIELLSQHLIRKSDRNGFIYGFKKCLSLIKGKQ